MEQLLLDLSEHTTLATPLLIKWQNLQEEAEEEARNLFQTSLQRLLFECSSFETILDQFSEVSEPFLLLGISLHCLNFGFLPPQKAEISDKKLVVEWQLTVREVSIRVELYSDVIILHMETDEHNSGYIDTNVTTTYDRGDIQSVVKIQLFLEKYYRLENCKTNTIKALFVQHLSK